MNSNSSAARISLLGIRIDRLTLPEAAERILAWSAGPRTASCRYVVTPNVDHIVKLQHCGDLQNAYRDASLVLADGAPLVLASRLLKRPLPERVAGSDLVPALLDAAQRSSAPLRLFLLGAAPGVAERAADKIHAAWPHVQVVGTCSPPPGFEHQSDQHEAILAAVAKAQADVVILGLGAPKQELWIHAHAQRLAAKVALCAGATIDFLAGHRKRAPRWMQRCGLEWLHRLIREPRRLAGRYARDAAIFPRLFWQEWKKTKALPRVP